MPPKLKEKCRRDLNLTVKRKCNSRGVSELTVINMNTLVALLGEALTMLQVLSAQLPPDETGGNDVFELKKKRKKDKIRFQ